MSIKEWKEDQEPNPVRLMQLTKAFSWDYTNCKCWDSITGDCCKQQLQNGYGRLCQKDSHYSANNGGHKLQTNAFTKTRTKAKDHSSFKVSFLSLCLSRFIQNQTW